MGGNITMTSEKNVGSIFQLIVPCRRFLFSSPGLSSSSSSSFINNVVPIDLAFTDHKKVLFYCLFGFVVLIELVEVGSVGGERRRRRRERWKRRTSFESIGGGRQYDEPSFIITSITNQRYNNHFSLIIIIITFGRILCWHCK